MNKYEALVCTGKMEVKAQDSEKALNEVKNMQKHLAEDDYINFAISFGRLFELAKQFDVDIMQEINEMLEFNPMETNIEREKKLNINIEELDLSVRTFNMLKRSGVNNVGDFIYDSEDYLLKTRMHGNKRSYSEVVEKVHALGFTDFPAASK